MALLRCGLAALMSLLPAALAAQPSDLPSVERQLKVWAAEMLDHPSLEVKKQRNREFSRLLIETLKRPESYTYPFDSLTTISRLSPEDGSFRIFTWQIVDQQNPEQYYGQQSHYYFGVVQRRYVENGQTEYLVIPLVEMPEIPAGAENMVFDNNRWLGGLYYPPRYHDHLPRYSLKYFDPKQMTAGGKVKKARQDFYLLMGWNGLDQRSNLKFVEVLSFDPKDKTRVIFGANVFYFDPVIPKFRAMFRYSEYAPFTLNYAYVKAGLTGRQQMIVYDHLASPKGAGRAPLEEIYEMGPDGSYDALRYDRGPGEFTWVKNIGLAEKYNSKLNQKELEARREAEQRKLREAGILPPPIRE
jgi:hypothetical protein